MGGGCYLFDVGDLVLVEVDQVVDLFLQPLAPEPLVVQQLLVAAVLRHQLALLPHAAHGGYHTRHTGVTTRGTRGLPHEARGVTMRGTGVDRLF